MEKESTIGKCTLPWNPFQATKQGTLNGLKGAVFFAATCLSFSREPKGKTKTTTNIYSNFAFFQEQIKPVEHKHVLSFGGFRAKL